MRISVISSVLCAAVVLAVFHSANAHNVVGIDFGSEWIKIGMVKSANVQIVLNEATKRKSPNVLGMDQDERTFGEPALAKPHLAYTHVRQLLGKRFSQEHLDSYPRHYFDFEVAENKDRGTFDIIHRTNKSHPLLPEELTAMMLTYVNHLSEVHASEPVTDIVITVPSYFAQFERQALLDAAEIAGLNVLALMNDHTAVALKFGYDHKVEKLEEPINVVFYNMGSTSTVVSVVNFHSVPDKDSFDKNKTLPQLQVKAVSWDSTLGGFSLTSALIDNLAEQSKRKDEIWDKPRSMGKLRKEAEKVKQVLSANKEAYPTIESLLSDFDFRGKVSRQELETSAANVFERVLEPIKKVLEEAKLTVDEIDRVEMVGGGWRVPGVQQRVREFFGRTGERDLDKTLNADEAFALGSALYAASLSTAFKLKKFGVHDITPFSVSIDIESPVNESIESDDESSDKKEEKTEDKPAAGGATKIRNIKLFKRGHKLPAKRKMTFKRDEDFVFHIKYDKPEEELPSNTPALVGTYNVSGIASAVAKYPNATKPRVNVSFRLNRNGMLIVDTAEVSLEETVEVEECEKPKNPAVPPLTQRYRKKKEKKKAKHDPKVDDARKLVEFIKYDADSDAALSKTELVDGALKDVPEDSNVTAATAKLEQVFAEFDADADGKLTKAEWGKMTASIRTVLTQLNEGEKSEESKDGDDKTAEKDSEDKKDEEEKKEDEKDKAEEAEPVRKCWMKEQKRVHRAPLKVAHEDGGLRPMTATQKKNAKAHLASFDERERLLRERSQAQHDLESFVYNTRDKLDHDDFKAVTTQEQRDAIETALTAAATWMDDEGWEATTEAFKKQYRELRDLNDPVTLRITEMEKRPRAIAFARTSLNATNVAIQKLRRTTAWLTDEDEADVRAKITKFETWLNESIAEQEKKELSEAPAFLSDDVVFRFGPVEAAYERLRRTPQPKPKAKAKTNSTDTNSTETKSKKKKKSKKDKEETKEEETKEEEAKEDETAKDDKTDTDDQPVVTAEEDMPSFSFDGDSKPEADGKGEAHSEL